MIEAIMASHLFADLDRMLVSEDIPAVLDYLTDQFRSMRQYALIFEARLMKKRFELGLPLIQTEPTSEFSERNRAPYEQAMIDAARETGALFLADGEIERAWPYFRAIGDPQPVSDAIERVQPGENMDSVIAIAFQEGVNPTKGLEFILKTHGICRAITSFGMYSFQKDRDRCIALLVGNVYAEIIERMTKAIESQEGVKPKFDTLPDLFASRPWLFGEYDYYVDPSHVVSLLPYCAEIKDRQTLDLFHQICDYGQRLSTQFQSRGEPPFENTYVDYGHYVQALLGNDVDAHISHFRAKISGYDPQEASFGPAQMLINLLVGLGRYHEALHISLRYLPQGESGLPCPSASQLCYLAGDYGQLQDLAKNRGDLLTYLAASAAAGLSRNTAAVPASELSNAR
jgi:hypothetical protein